MTASRSGSERLKVGIIGGGAITQVAHLPVLKKLKTIEVQAICDTDLPKARALADRFGGEGRVRRHRGSAPLRGPRRGGDLLPEPPARVAHPRGALRRTSTSWWRSRWRCRPRAPSGSSARRRSATGS